MATTANRFGDALKRKVLELRKNRAMNAEDIAEHINNMRSFEGEPELTVNSVYGITSRYGKRGNGNGNGAQMQTKTKKVTPCHVVEYLTTIGNDGITLSLSFPKSKLIPVLKQLGITE